MSRSPELEFDSSLLQQLLLDAVRSPGISDMLEELPVSDMQFLTSQIDFSTYAGDIDELLAFSHTRVLCRSVSVVAESAVYGKHTAISSVLVSDPRWVLFCSLITSVF
jgi:hypothetical protein